MFVCVTCFSSCQIRGPIILLIDDAHRMHPSSWSLLRALLSTAAAKVLVILARNPDATHPALRPAVAALLADPAPGPAESSSDDTPLQPDESAMLAAPGPAQSSSTAGNNIHDNTPLKPDESALLATPGPAESSSVGGGDGGGGDGGGGEGGGGEGGSGGGGGDVDGGEGGGESTAGSSIRDNTPLQPDVVALLAVSDRAGSNGGSGSPYAAQLPSFAALRAASHTAGSRSSTSGGDNPATQPQPDGTPLHAAPGPAGSSTTTGGSTPDPAMFGGLGLGVALSTVGGDAATAGATAEGSIAVNGAVNASQIPAGGTVAGSIAVNGAVNASLISAEGTDPSIQPGGTERKIPAGGTERAIPAGGTERTIPAGDTKRAILAGGSRTIPAGGTERAIPDGGSRAIPAGGSRTVLRLGPLSELEEGQLLMRWLRVAALPPALLPAVRARSGGNPYFAQELLFSLLHSGQVRRYIYMYICIYI